MRILRFLSTVKKAVYDGINYMLNGRLFSITIKLTMNSNLYKNSLTFRQVHYNINSDTNMPYSPLFENLFKDIQIELFKKGYYLIQNYDNYSFDNDCFNLSIGKPDGYDKEPVKYEGFNKIPEY